MSLFGDNIACGVADSSERSSLALRVHTCLFLLGLMSYVIEAIARGYVVWQGFCSSPMTCRDTFGLFGALTRDPALARRSQAPRSQKLRDRRLCGRRPGSQAFASKMQTLLGRSVHTESADLAAVSVMDSFQETRSYVCGFLLGLRDIKSGMTRISFSPGLHSKPHSVSLPPSIRHALHPRVCIH
ncbi:hypothetical protein PYCCODRAFT_1152413 [Trametes coccinea BRFM310]|uniref:Uncharacterized protein n=1 Tax=Trametes coccinea (strain BRFM310) TaxID=1353009 RepID=A0A1Y2IWL4_TRAC3|nr:hypothetical protein PYCCODRAFT_1152413 [Trametes coccinea BRFM310]